jgi:hypothetical protein
MTRLVVLMAMLLVSLPAAQPVPCSVIRKAVVRYGAAAVEAWARSKGISEDEIERARRCFK